MSIIRKQLKTPFFQPVFGKAGPSLLHGGVDSLRIIKEPLNPHFFYLFSAKQVLLLLHGGVVLTHHKRTAKTPVFLPVCGEAEASLLHGGVVLAHHKRTAKTPVFLPVFGEAGPSPSAWRDSPYASVHGWQTQILDGN